ncbi:CDP-diacylglycerol--glycerol-3-phosphate 3-phosphatidyltransferase [Geosporobacter subterraneus DSM 17957]|uniref:CDP-diacylglycerol--glycerol-3-phosphate 3-phosphatidyltransferase n=1 Tax=Geosporobacter subterraneus DSM 17957 TaxID=1121919 RepID=A0A1M6KRF0_9FIRM|nr:CDP-diacylglycerol--glycerol-3-phosphate 3-phosphatidyltransferase [Geosporobacter subterraneus]SHJ61496.1 CDP-diacylglycerol--glycerol-3-phosphate 3-phosphatidyltransferase [Geosporobacter subterraneus DSM 17957]
MNIPNILTALRFLLIPAFVYIFYSGSDESIIQAFYVFALAGVTDILDGYIARKYNSITKWGQAMDPLADKLMQLTVLACLTHRQYIPLWVILIIGAKETLLIIGALALYYHGNKRVIPSNSFGKTATVFFYGAIFAVVFQMPYHIVWVAAAVALTLMALIKYIIGFKKLHNKNFTG